MIFFGKLGLFFLILTTFPRVLGIFWSYFLFLGHIWLILGHILLVFWFITVHNCGDPIYDSNI